MRMEAWRYLNYTSSFPFPTTLVFSLGLSPASRVPRRAIRETGNLGLICWGSYTLILLPFSIPVSCCRLGFHEPVWCLCNVHHHCSVMLWISLVSSWEHLPGLILLHASSNCLFYTFLVLPHSQLPAPWLIFFFFFFWMKSSWQMSHWYSHYEFSLMLTRVADSWPRQFVLLPQMSHNF